MQLHLYDFSLAKTLFEKVVTGVIWSGAFVISGCVGIRLLMADSEADMEQPLTTSSVLIVAGISSWPFSIYASLFR